MEEGKNNKKIKITAVVLIGIFSVLVYLYMAYISYNNGVIMTVCASNDKVMYIEDGLNINIPFSVEEDAIHGINLPMDTNGDLQNGRVKVSVFSAQGEPLAECEKNSLIESNTGFIFDTPIEEISGKDLILNIECESESKEAGLFCSELVLDDGGMAPAFGVILSGNDSYFILQNVVYPIIIAVILTFSIIVLFDNRHKIKLHTLYLIGGLSLGLVYVLIIPISAVPDEFTHMYTAYDISAGMLGEDNDTLIMRADDAYSGYAAKNLTRADYVYQYDGVFDGVTDDRMVDSGIVATGYPRYLYIVSGLGITVGRLLGAGTTIMYLMGRFFNMLVFVLSVYYAIKKLPFGKGLVFVWAMLPITLQQTGSFSYDSPILSLSILVVASTIYALYGEEKDKRKRIINYIVWLISSLLIIPCKGHALVPLVMLILLLVPRYIRENRDKMKKYKPLALVLGVIFVLVTILFLVKIVKNVTLPENINNNYIAWAGQNGYTVGFFVKHPIRLLEILINTLWFKSDMYLTQMLGGMLGWLEIDIPMIFILGFLLLLIYTAMRKEHEEQMIRNGERIYIILMALGVVALSVMGMLLNWTPNSLLVVEGVQGRYFLPALVPIMLALRTRKNSVSDNADYNAAVCVVILQLFVVTAIFKNIL